MIEASASHQPSTACERARRANSSIRALVGLHHLVLATGATHIWTLVFRGPRAWYYFSTWGAYSTGALRDRQPGLLGEQKHIHSYRPKSYRCRGKDVIAQAGWCVTFLPVPVFAFASCRTGSRAQPQQCSTGSGRDKLDKVMQGQT